MRFFYSAILCLVLTATSAPVLNAVGSEQAQKGIQGLEAPPLGVKSWIQLPQGKETLDIFDYRGKTVVMLLFQNTCEACHTRAFPP